MIYLNFLRFILPLVLTMVVYDLSGPVLNGGMARLPHAAETLAGFGLAWGLTLLILSPFGQLNQLGLVLTGNIQIKRKAVNFVLACGLLMAGVLATLALTPLGVWVLQGLHRIDPTLSREIQLALLCFVPLPFLDGLIRYHTGLLLRARRTEIISLAMAGRIVASISAVILFLRFNLFEERPIWLPILATYAGVLIELAIISSGYFLFFREALLKAERRDMSYSEIGRFFWPLALIMTVQGMSRPIVNLFVSREPNGAESLAVLVVVYSLGHLPYGWLNELRSLLPAFRELPDREDAVRKFTILCGLLSFAMMAVLFWTPLRSWILTDLIGISDRLAERSAIPLFIFSFFPLVVTVRAYFHGVALVERRTHVLAPSGPSRIAIILLMLSVLPLAGLHGATLGVVSLLSGFLLETFVVWRGVRG